MQTENTNSAIETQPKQGRNRVVGQESGEVLTIRVLEGVNG